MDKVRVIIQKEWAEVFKNRIVLFTVALLPVIFTIMPLAILYFVGSDSTAGTATDMPPQFAQVCGDVTGNACTQVFIVYQFIMLFMILPMAIPVAISAYSIVGEKTTRCLEPLLATPISTLELLLGKALAAIIPAVGATWAGFVVLVAGVVVIAGGDVAGRLLDPVWLVAIVLAGPLIAVAAVALSIIVSSRVNDPRTAEQVSVILILPLMGVFIGQTAGLFLISAIWMAVLVVCLLLLDTALTYVAVKLFGREAILTRWK